MAKPRKVLKDPSLVETWYVYNWLMMGIDTFSNMTEDGSLFVKNVPTSYSAGACCLGPGGLWFKYHSGHLSFKTMEDIYQYAATCPRVGEIIDCRRSYP